MKIGQLYDLDRFKSFMDSASKPGFQDSDAGVILARSLTAVNPKIFEKKYPELTFINSGISVDNTGGYARRIQSLRVIERGDFADSSDYNSGKGRISLTAEDSFLKVFAMEAHSVWTDDEIKEAQLQNINLVQRYIATHNKAYLQKVDEIGFLGHNGQEGLLNYSGFVVTTASDTIDNLTPQQMYDEIATLITEQRNAVNNIPEYSCDTVVMPIRVMNKLQATILNTANGSASVLKALKDNFPDIKFMTSFRAENVGGASRVVAYSTNEDAMVMRIPIRLTIGEIIKQTSFSFRIDSKFRIAGLDVLENASARILTGL
jgi:hypothetical protein